MSHDEDLARFRAEMDQAVEGIKEFARSTRGYYDGLVEAGFSESDAFKLTTAWVRGVTSSSLGGSE